MHGWVLRDAAVPSNGCCFLAKEILEYCDSSVFIITTIMTMMMKTIKDIYFTFGCYLHFLFYAKISAQSWIKF